MKQIVAMEAWDLKEHERSLKPSERKRKPKKKVVVTTKEPKDLYGETAVWDPTDQEANLPDLLTRLVPAPRRLEVVEVDSVWGKPIKKQPKFECTCMGSYYCTIHCKLFNVGAKPPPEKDNKLTERDRKEMMADPYLGPKKKASTAMLVAQYVSKLAAQYAEDMVLDMMENEELRQLLLQKELFFIVPDADQCARRVKELSREILARVKKGPARAVLGVRAASR